MVLTSLDLACPIAWRSASTQVLCTSPTSISKGASLLSQHQHTDHASDNNDNEQWLQRRYHETLWLGEEHSPLNGFLQHLGRFERTSRRYSESPSQLMPSLARLLKSRQQIRSRFTAAASALKGDSALRGMFEGLCRCNEGEVYLREREVVKIALESGPGSLVGAELRKVEDKAGDAKLTRLWLKAIESRELQMQILLVLTLLRLSTQVPVMASPSTASSTMPPSTDRVETNKKEQPDTEQNRIPLGSTQPDINGESAAAISTTKRKRKVDHAKRWTGGKGMSAFPWTLQRQSSREGNLHDDTDDNDNDTSPESLSKRFESLLDSLCLQVVTSQFPFDDKHEAKDHSPSTSEQGEGRTAEMMHPWQRFGSEGRRRQHSKGEKDVLQWLCCHIIEPQFSKTLPRQCGIVRGKCFVPGSGSTPAKPGRREWEPPQLQKSHSRSAISIHRDQERQREKDQEVSRQRSMTRVRSESPAPFSKPVQPEETRMLHTSRSSSSLAGKWDARTVSVRRKWDRSQSIGPATKETKPLFERSSSVQPRAMTAVKEAPLVNRKESQTLVMDTPQKGQAFGSSMKSTSFSSQAPTSAAAASLAAWRRIESQPVLTAGIKRHLSGSICSDEEEGSIGIADSLFFEDSGDEDGPDEPNLLPTRLQPKTDLTPVSAAISVMSNLSRAPSLSHRSESQPIVSDIMHHSDDKGDSDDELKPIFIAKKRRTLPGSLSFAGLEQQCMTVARNPFAVTK